MENRDYKDMYFDLLADDLTVCNRYIKLMKLIGFLDSKIDKTKLTIEDLETYIQLMDDWKSEVVIHNERVRRYLENANGTEGNT